MARLSSIFLLLALAWSASAQDIIAPGPIMRTMATGAVSYLVNTDFEGTGYNDPVETWTENGTGTMDEDYTGVVLAGSQSLQLATSTQTARTQTSAFADLSDGWIYFLFRPVTLPGTDSGLVVLYDGSTTVCRVLINSTGTLVVRAGSSGGATTSAAMSAGTTYHVWVHYISGTGADAVGTVAFSTDGIKPTSGTSFASVTNGNATTPGDNINLGTIIGGAGSTINFIYDHVLVDDATIGDSP